MNTLLKFVQLWSNFWWRCLDFSRLFSNRNTVKETSSCDLATRIDKIEYEWLLCWDSRADVSISLMGDGKKRFWRCADADMRFYGDGESPEAALSRFENKVMKQIVLEEGWNRI